MWCKHSVYYGDVTTLSTMGRNVSHSICGNKWPRDLCIIPSSMNVCVCVLKMHVKHSGMLCL